MKAFIFFLVSAVCMGEFTAKGIWLLVLPSHAIVFPHDIAQRPSYHAIKVVVSFFDSETEERRGVAARVQSLLCEVRDSFGSKAGTEKQWPPSSHFFSCGHSVFSWSIAQEIIFRSNMGQQLSEPRSR